MNSTPCFIINPASGNSKKGIIKTITNYFPGANIYLTENPGSGSLMARRAQQLGEKIIIACGGDGTIHEVVNGLELPDPNLIVGVLPTGTGNALAARLNIPLNTDKALKALSTRARTMPMDLGEVDSERFINTVSIGLDAEINQKAIGLKSRFSRLPLFSYIPAIIKTMLSKHSWPIVSVYFGEELIYREKTAIVSITNTPYYGIGLPINPKAKIDDGKLNLCLIKQFRERAIPYCLLKIALKKQEQSKKFLLKEFEVARVSSEEPLPLQIDGEPVGLIQEFNVSILKKAVNILYIP